MEAAIVKINSAQAPQESGALKTSDEERFVVALRELKLKDMSYVEVKKPLKYAMLLVGLRESNLPSELELRIIINHAQNQYGNHTASEVGLAFDLAVAGKLDIKDVNCYENFSCLYFSSIMNAYKQWTYKQQKKIVSDIKPKEIEPEDKTPMTDEEKVEFARKMYQMTKNYGYITRDVVIILYRQKKIEKPCEEDCLKIERQATAAFSEELKAGIDPKSGITLKSILEHMSYEKKQTEIKKIMNQILVAKYFNT